MATEQQFYEMLARIDHPLFPRDMTSETTADSPFNSIMNRLNAKQLVKLQVAIDSLSANSFPQSCDENTIDRWEYTYGLNNSNLDLPDRIIALLIKRNQKIKMSAPTVIAFAQAITGQTPYLIRNLWKSGWVLGQSILGVTTVLSTSQDTDAGLYIVIFTSPLTSAQRTALDNALTQIEKGGSRHSIVAPSQKWVLGKSALSVDTVLS